MNSIFKKIGAVVLSVAILGIAYYGSYLPMRKSQVFIATLSSLPNVHSLKEFEDSLSVALDTSSPIGQEELVRNSGSVVLNLAQGSGRNNPQITTTALEYLDNYYQPIIRQGKGMSFGQNLIILGLANQVAFEETRQVKYFEAAKKYYSRGLELSPTRPQFLYGMFDIYRTENNVEGAKAIGEQILKQWPEDIRIQKAIDELLARQVKK